LAQKDQRLRAILKEGDFLIPDGAGIKLALRILYGRGASHFVRITGIDLMQYLLEEAARKEFRVFFFGGSPEVNSYVFKKLRHEHPALKLVGSEHGYIPDNQYGSLIEKINDLNVDVLFVGLGSPKQEKWIDQHKNALKAKISIGVGGSLDVLAGKVSRAPSWMRFFGLEWLFRLFKEPSRLRRQMALPRFVIKVLAARINA
jgi:N-acetylglucosaminyldiphosphoundecaprenol N-acetyl-beta-D-mannosaminyltransferase